MISILTLATQVALFTGAAGGIAAWVGLIVEAREWGEDRPHWGVVGGIVPYAAFICARAGFIFGAFIGSLYQLYKWGVS